MRATLAAICTFTLLATAYLTASLLILRPPRANSPQWALIATVVAAQCLATLIALGTGRPKGLRYAAAPGGAALVALGAWWVHATLSDPHFEGYALVLGSAMVVQGLLTLATFAQFRIGAD